MGRIRQSIDELYFTQQSLKGSMGDVREFIIATKTLAEVTKTYEEMKEKYYSKEAQQEDFMIQAREKVNILSNLILGWNCDECRHSLIKEFKEHILESPRALLEEE